jgi:hypothetical protein
MVAMATVVMGMVAMATIVTVANGDFFQDQRGRSLTNDYENNTTTSSFAGRDTEKLTGISSFTAASETSRQTDV